jgi:hypothetical protein
MHVISQRPVILFLLHLDAGTVVVGAGRLKAADLGEGAVADSTSLYVIPFLLLGGENITPVLGL